MVDRDFWYVPDAGIAPGELVSAALFTQRCVLCGRHFKQPLCAAVTAALRTGFTAAVMSASRLADKGCPV
jgi:hypothetical protein